MDILTKKGQKSLEYERTMLERISILKKVNIIETDKLHFLKKYSTFYIKLYIDFLIKSHYF